MRRGSSGSSPEARRRLSAADYALLMETMGWLAAARLAVLLVPFRHLSRRLGAHMSESSTDLEPARIATLKRVRWAIGAVGRRVPWRCQCLEQALAAKMLLRVRGCSNTLYLGVARNGGAQVDAHAWLRSGAFLVVGGEGHERFAVVSTFADPAP